MTETQENGSTITEEPVSKDASLEEHKSVVETQNNPKEENLSSSEDKATSDAKNSKAPGKTQEKSAEKKKSDLIILTTKPISEQELRDKMNKEFGKNNQYYNVLKEAVDSITGQYKKKLTSMMILIREGVKPDYKMINGEVKSVEFRRKLSNEELENFVISIPVELFFIQEIMDDRALDMDLSEQLKEFHITEKILEIQGGTEKERIRAAEYNSMMPIFTTIIKNRVYYNLKNEIEQASKVYDALKRVIQLRITEMQTFGKSQEFGSSRNDGSVSKIDIEIEIDPEISDFIITTPKYPNGIKVIDLFFNHKDYFEWVKNNKTPKGAMVEYQKRILEFDKAMSMSKII